MRQKVTQRLLQMVRTAAKKAKATRSGTTVQSSTRRLQSLGKKKRKGKKKTRKGDVCNAGCRNKEGF